MTSAGDLPEEELMAKFPSVHALGIRSKTHVSKKILDAAKRLLVVGAFCIGTEQIESDYAAKKGVAVFNAPFANTRSVAEMVLAEMIVLARQLGDRSMECHKKEWFKNSKGCFEVRGKTVGIIGYGHVGSQLSVLAESLGMHVIYYDVIPVLPLGNAKPETSLQRVLTQADFVSLHVPGGNETNKLIGAKELAMMKKGSYLLNASRGSVVDVDAAAAAIKSKHLAGAAFDVFPVEPPPIKGAEFKSVLQGLPNVILTPHIGGSTEEAQAAIGKEVAQKMVQFINTGTTISCVNLPSVSLPHNDKVHRVLNVHKNVPGVLRDVNAVLDKYNVVSQMLLTNRDVGYLMVEVDQEVSQAVKEKIEGLASSIRTRILY